MSQPNPSTTRVGRYNRRRFLEVLGVTGVAGAIGVGLYGRAQWQRSALAGAMLNDAQQVMVPREQQELQTLPVRARNEIRDWFHVHCLNAAEFAYEVCSPSFAERLAACATDELKQQCVANAFLARVVSAEEVQERLQVIAQELGNELDTNWRGCCQQLSQRWQMHISGGGYEASLPRDLSARLDHLVQNSLREAVQTADGSLAPSFTDAVSSIGTAALLALPVAWVLPELALPAFVVRTLWVLGEYVVRLLSGRVEGIQAEITHRVALLGRRLGSEYEAELRHCIGQLHRWQQDAVRTFTEDYSRTAISII